MLRLLIIISSMVYAIAFSPMSRSKVCREDLNLLWRQQFAVPRNGCLTGLVMRKPVVPHMVDKASDEFKADVARVVLKQKQQSRLQFQAQVARKNAQNARIKARIEKGDFDGAEQLRIQFRKEQAAIDRRERRQEFLESLKPYLNVIKTLYFPWLGMLPGFGRFA